MKSSILLSVTFTVTILLVFSYINTASALRLSNLKTFTESKPLIEGRSLLDLLLGSANEGNAATSVKVSNSVPEKTSATPVLDLAQSLIGKDNGNANLYLKIFKLIFNLFMDAMMDRMDLLDLRREDIQPEHSVHFLRVKNLIAKKSPIFQTKLKHYPLE